MPSGKACDDEPADCLFVIDILEHQFDVKAALEDIKRLTKRAALICIKADFRGREYWQDMIGRYFYVNEVVEDKGMMSFVANAKTLVPGAKIIPAGTDESRWENIKASVLKYPDIVQEAPAHNRRAIIGCYGPSLQQSWPALLEQSKDPDSDVVSVSGAHDFLLSKGIVPRFTSNAIRARTRPTISRSLIRKLNICWLRPVIRRCSRRSMVRKSGSGTPRTARWPGALWMN
jgi:hypothetical protein